MARKDSKGRVRTVRSSVHNASRELEGVMRKPRASRGDRVLVVYEKREANIYYEGDAAVPAVVPTPETVPDAVTDVGVRTSR
ncbi:MAG: hypothetical protein ACKVPX_17985 [Myxococcaceae bacterium]